VKRSLGYVLLGLCAYSMFMVLQFPATVLLAWQPPPSDISIQSVQGLAVQGSAQGLQWHVLRFDTATWKLRFLPLLLGRIELEVDLNDPARRLTGIVAVGLDRQLRIGQLRGHLPLRDWHSVLKLPVGGGLELNDLQLRLDPNGYPLAAQGTVFLSALRVTLAQTLELGNFRVTFSTADDIISGLIQDRGGPVQLTGILTLTPDGRYRLIGQVAVRENNQPLEQTLSLLGQPDPDGVRNIDLTGTLRF
jgi:general secretion pathway protein N